MKSRGPTVNPASGAESQNRRIDARKIALTLLLLASVAACRKKVSAPVNINAANKVAPRAVRLYFEGPSMLLIAEPRSVQLPENPAGAMSAVVRELIKGPASPGFARSFPADTVVRGAFLLPDGTAFVDLGGGTLTAGWTTGSHEELIAIYSLVQTITANFSEARQVRLLVNGAPAETLAGHVALERSLRPAAWLVDPRAR